jgi:hypothetical protein
VYREQLLERAIHTLAAPGGKLDNEDDPLKRAQTVDVLTYVQLLMESATVSADSSTKLKHTNIHVICKY